MRQRGREGARERILEGESGRAGEQERGRAGERERERGREGESTPHRLGGYVLMTDFFKTKRRGACVCGGGRGILGACRDELQQ